MHEPHTTREIQDVITDATVQYSTLQLPDSNILTLLPFDSTALQE